jgi:DNA helicase IV
MLYGRLDDLRDRASGRLSKVLLETGGTPAARSERDAFVEMYSQRITQLDAAENGLCFGRLDLAEGDSRYIGRIGILDDASDYEALLVDWRAPAARPFYIATAFSPEGVLRRRHIRTRQRQVTGVDDEVLDVGPDGQASPDRAAGHAGLTGEAALIAALSATRTGRMADIVETIQAEQDLIIRSPHSGVTVVQGAPGTGKTAVALHRAAYLLYTYREQLSRRGVLIVGPNPTFLRYIGHVLPSLGETGVLMSTIADLYPGITARRGEAPETAEIKGRPAMAGVLAAAVRNRQQLPAEPVEITFEREVLTLDRKTVQQARERARRSRRPHNQARPIFVREIINALVQQVTSKFTAGLRETDKMVAEILGEEVPVADSTVLGSADTEDIRAELREDPKVRAAIAHLWPVLTPQRLLDELFASPRRLAAAAPRLPAAERDLLRREPRGGWTPADVPLLDEAAELLGDDDRLARQRARRERQQQVAYAQGVLDIVSRDLEDDPEILMAYDLLNADRLAGRHEELSYLTTAERAALDRTWAFGHIVVDEAQELSEMAWRMLMRRCPSRSMTIAGDIAQSSNPAGAVSWEQILTPHLGNRWRLDRLTINYRTPAEIMAVAADVLAKIDADFDVPMSVRETGTTPWRQEVKADELAYQVAAAAVLEAAEAGGGNVAVLVPPALVGEVTEAVTAALRAGSNGHRASGAGPDSTGPDSTGPDNAEPDGADSGDAADVDGPDLDKQVVVLTVSQAKGLEFDSVLIADPAQILGESPRGLSDLYVAMTRATQRLGVVHPGPVPEVLERLAPRP